MDSIDSQISYSLPQRHRAQHAAEQTDSTGLAAVHACWFYYEHVGIGECRTTILIVHGHTVMTISGARETDIPTTGE